MSFFNQLSKTYLEMMNSNAFQQRTMSDDKHKIEGLVAEHGFVLAVLLSRPVVLDYILPFRSSKPEIDQPIALNNRVVHCSDSIKVTFFKYTRDFLQTGQAFLRQGIKKRSCYLFSACKEVLHGTGYHQRSYLRMYYSSVLRSHQGTTCKPPNIEK